MNPGNTELLAQKHRLLGDAVKETKQSTQASSNYGIDRDDRVALYVEEKNRSWCSSSNANDQRAITIECASDRRLFFIAVRFTPKKNYVLDHSW